MEPLSKSPSLEIPKAISRDVGGQRRVFFHFCTRWNRTISKRCHLHWSEKFYFSRIFHFFWMKSTIFSENLQKMNFVRSGWLISFWKALKKWCKTAFKIFRFLFPLSQNFSLKKSFSSLSLTNLQMKINWYIAM